MNTTTRWFDNMLDCRNASVRGYQYWHRAGVREGFVMRSQCGTARAVLRLTPRALWKDAWRVARGHGPLDPSCAKGIDRLAAEAVIARSRSAVCQFELNRQLRGARR